MKNINFRQRFLSIITAGMLLVTPTIGHTDDNKNEDNNSEQEFTLVMQEKEIKPMTIEEFRLGVKEAYDYLKVFIDYDDLQKDLQCLYYLVNRDYIKGDVEKELR